ncbi:MAG: hypothetical protein FJ077_11180 [Cyanobacteria bacterium K_DeepCast_35m_m2_023]|nr:hypothetical protein [Cyanobacteria bacterium K_DeepCast_35m_m2_023]
MLANLPKDLAPLQSFRDCDGTVKDFSYSPFELIKMATSNNGLILTLSGPRTPYNGVDNKPLKPGTIGVIRPNAVADLILVRGNPLKSLDFFNNSDNIVLVMKDGTIYKNLLDKRGDDGTRSMGR